MISISMLVTVVLTIIVAGLVFWLLIWLIDYCGIPEPFNKIAHVLVAIVAVLVIIGVLMSMIGGQQIFRP
jgi:hypothetical protein